MSATDLGPEGIALSEPTTEQLAEEPKSITVDTKGLANEFDPIVPELRPGGTILLGEEEFQLPRKMEPGIECKVRPLRTRHVLLVGRILLGSTRPVDVGDLVTPFMSAVSDDDKEVALIGAITEILLTIPHSEREFIELLSIVVQVVEDIDADTQRALTVYLNDPSILDTIRIITQMVTNERKNLKSLGEALRVMFPGVNLTGTPGTDGEVAST